MENCISCDTLSGNFIPPGGIVYQGEYWSFFLRAKPLLLAGPGFIVLNRHCEDFDTLSRDELHTLAETMQLVSRAYTEVLQAEKVHFGLYGEGVKHIHLHVLPRTKALPAGNIPIRYMRSFYGLLNKIGLKKSVPDEEVAAVAGQLRAVLGD